MSVDSVDDLECAEDMCATLAEALRQPWWSSEGYTARQRALAEWTNYCRPSCELDEGDQYTCDEDCGCPCGHPGRDGASSSSAEP